MPGNVLEKNIQLNLLLDSIGCCYSFNGSTKDYSCITNSINYNDFLELFCRIVVSDFWVYKKPEEVVVVVNESEVSDENKEEVNNADNNNNNNATDNTDAIENDNNNNESNNETKEGSEQVIETEKPIIPLNELLLLRLTEWSINYDFSQIL